MDSLLIGVEDSQMRVRAAGQGEHLLGDYLDRGDREVELVFLKRFQQ